MLWASLWPYKQQIYTDKPGKTQATDSVVSTFKDVPHAFIVSMFIEVPKAYMHAMHILNMKDTGEGTTITSST